MRIGLPATLAATALLLGAAIVYESMAPLPAVTVEAPRASMRMAPATLTTPYAPPSEDMFADIDARPLFSAGRKPLIDPGDAAGAASAASDFSLVGVIMDGERAVALLRSKSTSLTTSAVMGGIVNGWRVKKIDATEVTLNANGGDFVVPLEGPADRPPSAPLQPASEAAAPPSTIVPPPATTQPLAPPRSGPATAAPAPNGATAATAPRPLRATIAKDALKGAPIDPTTGEPTL